MSSEVSDVTAAGCQRLDCPVVSGTVVMKFGGTSVADAERLKRAARRIVAARELGHRVVAVLSARGKTTDELISMAELARADDPPRGALDALGVGDGGAAELHDHGARHWPEV